MSHWQKLATPAASPVKDFGCPSVPHSLAQLTCSPLSERNVVWVLSCVDVGVLEQMVAAGGVLRCIIASCLFRLERPVGSRGRGNSPFKGGHPP